MHERRNAESGFTLVELIVTTLIVTVLMVIIIMTLASARESARNRAMATASATINTGISTFARIYSPTELVPVDQLVTRNGGVWTTNAHGTTTGMTDETGQPILRRWPDNPFGNTGIIVRRYASSGYASCLSGGRPGEVRVCRIPGAHQSSYLVTGWGTTKSNPKLVYCSFNSNIRPPSLPAACSK